MRAKYQTPFLHYAIPNFLSQEKYQRIKQVYSKLQFLEKESDLFHFFQTNELNSQPSLQFFKDELSKQFGQLTDLKDTSYNIFASYYFKGDYLLCHDDVIDDRKYAFSYYLQDHSSGQLVLYDKTATKIEKQIAVTQNLLVIFQVSNISYHQVAFTKQDGRKAVTGWLNIKGLSAKRQARKIQEFKPNLPTDLLKYELKENLQQEEFYHFPQIQYCFNVESTSIAGPFYQRKATKLELQNTVVFELQGYELYSADFFKFSEGDYILLNDSINNIGDNILDVFIVQLPKKVKNSDESLIQIVDEKGSVSGIPYINNSVFIIQRNSKNYFVDRVQKEFFLGHLIYKKIVKGKKGKVIKIQKSRAQVGSIRKQLMNHYNEERKDEGKKVPNLQKTKGIKKQKGNKVPSKSKKQ